MERPPSEIARQATPFAAGILGIIVACGGAAAAPEEPAADETPASAGAEQSPAAHDEAPAAGGTFVASAPPPADGAPENPLDAQYAEARPLRTLRGKASYYHDSLAGNHTANGDIYDPTKFTAANRRLPFGTIVRVTRRDTGASVVVRVNDRGPFGDRRRVLDLSRAAAERLDMIRAGVVDVRVDILHRPD